MRTRPDPLFTNTKGMEVGDIIGFDPSTEGIGSYEEGVVAKLYPFSLVLESGKAVGVARITMHRRPDTTKHFTASEKSRTKSLPIRSDCDDEPLKKYIAFPF